MRIVRKGAPGYDAAREMNNARFDLKPDAIYYCDNQHDAADVVRRLGMCSRKTGIRVRAGGHQHEGMSSGDGVSVIDISEISRINFERRSGRVWIGAGAELQILYGATDAKRRLFPGGGCDDVHIGGLVLGGGWGFYTRHLGLCCDRLKAVRLVTADGQSIEVSDKIDGDLMWALRGGGGGNFGVVTDFFYELDPWPDGLERPSNFTIQWNRRSLIAEVMAEWATNFPVSTDNRLTSLLQITLVEKELDAPEESDDVPLLLEGTYIGTAEQTEAALAELLPTTFDKRYRPKTASGAGSIVHTGFRHSHARRQYGPPRREVVRMAGQLDRNGLATAPADVQSTCAGNPYPHKVSGFMPKTNIEKSQSGSGRPVHTPDPALIETVHGIFNEPAAPASKVRCYLSLHSLGGEVFTNETYRRRSAFPYRDKPFILQPEAWWADPDDTAATREGLDFIARLRERLAPYSEGGFINFPDRDLTGPDQRDRDALLRPYYGEENLEKLKQIKSRMDPNNLFDFPMGIPPTD